jgi:hypothetical protein
MDDEVPANLAILLFSPLIFTQLSLKKGLKAWRKAGQKKAVCGELKQHTTLPEYFYTLPFCSSGAHSYRASYAS